MCEVLEGLSKASSGDVIRRLSERGRIWVTPADDALIISNNSPDQTENV